MKVLGITGGVGSGKSEVLDYLESRYGAYVCQMDEVAKRLEKRGEICFRKIVDRFGEAVVGTDGELDRKKLGEIVLDYVKKDIEKRKKEGRKLYVLESALLAEAGQELCDKIWYIYTEENVRRIRLERSRGYTQEKITQMMASQLSVEQFRENCTDVIDNSGDFKETKRQIGAKIQL